MPTSVTVGSSARRAQVGGGRGAGLEGGEQLLGHLVAEGVDDEQRGRACLSGHGAYDVVEQGPLLERGLGQEAVGAAESGEVARPRVGPGRPELTDGIEALAEALVIGGRGRDRAAAALEVAVGAINGGAVAGVAGDGLLEAAEVAEAGAGGGEGLAEMGDVADELPGELARRLDAEPEGRAAQAKLGPARGYVPLAGGEGVEGGGEDLVLLEAEGVDVAEVLRLRGLDLGLEAALGLVGGAAVEVVGAGAEVRGELAASVDHGARQGVHRAQALVGRLAALEVVDVLDAEGPARYGEGEVLGADLVGGDAGVTPGGADT
jgi:hypothetical protein